MEQNNKDQMLKWTAPPIGGEHKQSLPVCNPDQERSEELVLH